MGAPLSGRAYIFVYMVITGIDYSLRSPAICTHMGTEWNYSNCIFHFLSDRKKYSDVFCKRFFGKSFESFNTDLERYDSISSWAVEVCDFSEAIPVDTLTPSEVKKFGSGKGNASKDLMYESFLKETGVNLIYELNMKQLGNPATDIVDAYYICKLLYYNLNNLET